MATIPAVHAPAPPDLDALTAGLARVFGTSPGGVDVLERIPNVYATSAQTEIVVARVGRRAERRLFVKHASARAEPVAHRGGAAYESAVHRHVLAPLGVSRAVLFGTFEVEGRGTSAVFDWLPDAMRVGKSPDATAIERAARWIGTLHRRSQTVIVRCAPPLVRHDAPYYEGWVERTIAFATRGRRRWLEPVGARARDAFASFAASPGTVTHGEFYPNNVLVDDDGVYPVDWETAAIAPGEVDLAALTEGWAPDVVARCERVYALARWGQRPDDGFGERLATARLHLAFRWLGDRASWTTDARADTRYEYLRSEGARLGWIEGAP
jgi:hypothetical protein